LAFAAAVALLAAGCMGLEYDQNPANLSARGHAIDYQKYRVLVSNSIEPPSEPLLVNCFDDAACIQKLQASVEMTAQTHSRIFVAPPDGSRLWIEHGAAGSGIRAIGWNADLAENEAMTPVSRQSRQQFDRLADPSTRLLRLKIRLPFTVDISPPATAGGTNATRELPVGGGNPELFYKAAYSPRRAGVVPMDAFVEKSIEAAKTGKPFALYPAPACRSVKLTLMGRQADGKLVDIGATVLTVPDIGYVQPVPFTSGSVIALHSVCGTQRVR